MKKILITVKCNKSNQPQVRILFLDFEGMGSSATPNTLPFFSKHFMNEAYFANIVDGNPEF